MTSGGSAPPSSKGALSCPPGQGAMWSLIVPFKGGDDAKSRLQGDEGLGKIRPGLRRQLALGFLRDTVAEAAASASVERIIIVSSDPGAVIDAAKIQMLPDPGLGLNAAIEAGFVLARSLRSGNPVAAVTADLPCLTTADLEYALHCAEHRPLSVVADRQGTGTTMISALPGAPVHPLFGHGSRDAHLLAGHSLLPVPQSSTLRADVDTLDDLAAAVQRGVGDRTRTVLFASALFSAPPPLDGESLQSYPLEKPTVQRKSCPA
jgi:2-phospho-L-lactate/phosphoenolpyruvate guanylyltransferase